jgi:dCTP deaminase
MTTQGGILADSEIRRAIACGDIEIDPYEPAHVNPVSIDLTLGDLVRVYSACGFVPTADGRSALLAYNKMHDLSPLDAHKENPTHLFSIVDTGYVLMPGVGYLMHTRETIHTKKYVPIIDGKSSLGRLFMSIHETAGFGDPGYRGQYTLEVSVVHPLRVYAGMRIAQMRFHTICGQVEKPYAGNYTGEDARGPVASKAYKQFKGAR